MFSVAVLTQVLGLAIGAGLNLYAAVLMTGLGIRYGWLPQLPTELQVLGHPAVLGVAGVMYAAEFIADKVPFFTPIWDGIHTFIRPVGGALLALGATATGPTDAGPDELDPASALEPAGLPASARLDGAGARLLAGSDPLPGRFSLSLIVQHQTQRR